MSTRWRLAVLAGLFTLVTACGNAPNDAGDGVASISDKNTPSSTKAEDEGDDYDKMLAYAKCMREQGVDIKDPEPPSAGEGGGGIGISVDGPDEKAKVDKANESCKHLMPNGGAPEKPSAEELDEARKTAKCLREHGIEVKEPTAENPGLDLSAGEGGNTPEKVDKAMQECMPEGAKSEKHSSNGGGGGK
ncbi:hypothetical protein [Actinophytocola sp.]|uniref:hypothetical protein n=1 Tax=Actinophytocola sp. TaxID=1872138 RepID=UPI002ED15415